MFAALDYSCMNIHRDTSRTHPSIMASSRKHVTRLYCSVVSVWAMLLLVHADQPIPLSISSSSPNTHTLSWPTDNFHFYQPESSSNLLSWTTFGAPISGTGNQAFVTDGPVFDSVKFYRLRISPQFPGFNPTLIIRSGFEPAASLFAMSSSILGFQGVDHSVLPPNDWTLASLDPNIGDFYIQMAWPGTTSDRSAYITTDPANPLNHVLAFQTINATEAGPPLKGRIQTMVANNTNLHEIYYKEKLYLPTDISYLKDYTFPPGNWLTFMEFWDNPDWTTPAPYPFRVTVYVISSADKKNLNFRVLAETMDPGNEQSVWTSTNTTFGLPFNEWFTLEAYYKEGNASTGRFYLAATRANGQKTVLFDVTNFTCHPSNPSPTGLAVINPMKMYCSKAVVDWIATHQPQNGTMRIYWDDFEFWKNTPN